MATGFIPLPFFAGFTAFTPEVPKLYWDVKSAEQRYFTLCKELHKLICYADALAARLNEITEDTENTLEQFKQEISEQLAAQDAKIAQQLAAQDAKVAQALEDMRLYIDMKFDEMAESQQVYDVTTGKYRTSAESMRRLYSALAYDHTGSRAIVSDIANNLAVAQLADMSVYKCAWSDRNSIIIDDQIPTIEQEI